MPINRSERISLKDNVTLDNIYTGGGSDITAGLLTDTTNSFVYNSVADTIGTIASIPRATGETRALNFNGLMLVMGGGRTAPNPSNEVNIYNPGTNSWTTGAPVPAFTTPRRNFATDTDGTTRIWLAGGYASDGVTPLDSTEVFCGATATPTPTPTPPPTPTPTPPPTPTPSPPPTPTPTATPTPTPPPTPTPTPTPPPTPSATPTPTPTPTPGPITLSAAGRKVGGVNTVRLTWSGATSPNIDVYRDGMPIVRTANDGSYVDSTGDTGRARYTYRVCEAGTQTCSNNARVMFRQ